VDVFAGTDSDRRAALSLLNARAVRERADEILEIGLEDRLEHFRVAAGQLPESAGVVAAVIRDRYPTLAVPFHARWRQFVVFGQDVWQETAAKRPWPDRAARARSEFDVAIVSVLLDAGAGPLWSYRDATTAAAVGRSEGLALASLRMFEAGVFAAVARDPLRADAVRLAAMDAPTLGAGFGVSENNPLVGLDERTALMARLGAVVMSNPAIFAREDAARPGGLYDYLVSQCEDARLSAPRILEQVLIHLGPIWSGRLSLGGLPLGDTWRHSAVRRADPTDGLVPLHKLSQWLVYSLIEPLVRAGIHVTDIDGLTGLAEYRNGGLFVDTGVIAAREPTATARPHTTQSPLVVEWRALTVSLLDRIAPLVRARLGLTAAALPLACVLEGGTWAAGRWLARECRPDGGPPIKVISDGTVF
jgi:Protein of unknown function (DUF1688)